MKKEKIYVCKKRKIFSRLLRSGGGLLIFAFVKRKSMDYGKERIRVMPRCLECGDRISYGRRDKKFCSEDCRNRHHNHISQAGRRLKRRVMASLEKNYSILDDLVRSGVESISLTELMIMGFNPGYATSFRKLRSRMEICCFDICYILTPSRLYSISKIQNLCVHLQDVSCKKEHSDDY